MMSSMSCCVSRMFESVIGKPEIRGEEEHVLLQHVLEGLRRVVVKVRRRVPHAEELRRLEHVGEERRDAECRTLRAEGTAPASGCCRRP